MLTNIRPTVHSKKHRTQDRSGSQLLCLSTLWPAMIPLAENTTQRLASRCLPSASKFAASKDRLSSPVAGESTDRAGPDRNQDQVYTRCKIGTKQRDKQCQVLAPAWYSVRLSDQGWLPNLGQLADLLFFLGMSLFPNESIIRSQAHRRTKIGQLTDTSKEKWRAELQFMKIIPGPDTDVTQ